MLVDFQDVEVGDVNPKAIVRRVDATIGMLLELPTKASPAAGYVHVSISAFLSI